METAKDNYPIKYGTKIEADYDGCTVTWSQKTRQKRVHDPLTNTPILQTFSGAIQYQAVEATFVACGASYLCQQIRVGLDQFQGAIKIDPAKLIAKDDINWLIDGSKASEGVSCDDETVKTSNLSSERQQENLKLRNKQLVDRITPFTFLPTPLLNNEEFQEISAYANYD